jgi:hypothetical protein
VTPEQYRNLFLGRDPASTSPAWSETQIQSYVVMNARRAVYVVHGDTNGANKTRLSASQAKATGMLAGWPDLCFAVPGCPVFVEMKKADGRLSHAQKAVHDHMAAMGYPVHTVFAPTPASAWEQVKAIPV